MTEGVVEFGDWEKLDLRVGEIVEVNEIEGADKLYKLTIDIGEEEKKTVCSGLKPYYSKEDLQNKRVILFVNLKPRKLMGIESQGMVLAAGNVDHSEVKLLQPEGDIKVGARIS